MNRAHRVSPLRHTQTRVIRATFWGILLGAVALAACAESPEVSAEAAPLENSPHGTGCATASECPAGWTCVLSQNGEVQNGVCTAPPKAPASPATPPDGPEFSYEPWSAWSSCPTPCGGEQTRARTCKRNSDGTSAPCARCGTKACSETRPCTACPTGPCTATPWGDVPDGFTGDAYYSATPKGRCVKETRTCRGGTLTGTFKALSCVEGCVGTPWGSVADGFTGTAYLLAKPAPGVACSAASEPRTCTAGTMSGSYPISTCTANRYVCDWHGSWFPVLEGSYDSSSAPSPWHECQADGTWADKADGAPAVVGPPCEWGGRWFRGGTCGNHDGTRYRCGSTGWEIAPTCLAP